MLDTDTKRRIDTARDILVGKVPDPKSQVQYITYALIYKFMDDMDAHSEELGGKRKFFTGEFARYGWAKLMRSGLGGHEMLDLYSEALIKMRENSLIPQLFRTVFKDAYQPFRDPETLRALLKVIDEFEYDHSERLGDAFEYLLSVLGSQGDAGQFRTPRHIIDFIVKVVDPKKNETVLDPACGTAGFLISSYKHILKANTDKKDGHPGGTLTPDERKKLADNFRGYDISPDMVRLSLVNLYLHGFTDPHIDEYDTLTSQDKWNETADVILANPPFMSPKGGIRPHNRFSVQSKRSEVLFVDYMAEHLTPTGRAGIIVPEGIIFQSQTAYKTLRKMLVEQYLVAVVSLPAGVFQPYSGVKTSILILDKSLAKQSDTVGFFKVENDGFGLGAQRREVKGEQLTQVAVDIGEYFRRLRARESVAAEDFTPTLGLIVAKEKIAANGDFNLSGERYRENGARSSTYPLVPVGELCELIAGNTPSKRDESYWQNGTVKWISSKHIDECGAITGYELISARAVEDNSTKVAPKGSTIIITRVSVGKFAFADDDYAVNQDLTALVVNDSERIAPEYLQVVARHISEAVEQAAVGIGVRGVTREFLSNFEIPLPPLAVQKEIVAEIEGYQKVIDGARAVLDHYRPHIPTHPEWPMVELGKICEIGGTITSNIDGSLPSFGADSIESNTGKLLKTQTAANQNVRGPVYEFSGERLLYSKIRPYLNKLTVVNLRGYCSSDMYPLKPDQTKVEISFLATFMLSEIFNEGIRGYYERASIPKINRSQLFSVQIPLPPLATQQQIVAEIEAEQRLVASNRELIERFEKKIAATLARIWGDNDTPSGGAANGEG